MTLRLALYAVPIAVAMSWRAYRKGSLSASGAACAVLTGAIAMTASLRLGLVLIVFFLSSSRVTRVGARQKAALEGREYAGPGGNRSCVQVLANGATATALALAYIGLHAADGATERPLAFDGDARAASLVQLAYVCHYACCNADTWASELGILASSPPRLITTGAPVRPGTNGGVSPLGVGASIAGGLAIGLAFWLSGLALLPAPAAGAPPSAEWLALCAGPLAGFVGSGIDSLLGASFQFSGYCPQRRCVVEAPGPGVVKISGRPWLSNHAVNFVSSLLTAAAGAALAALATAAPTR